MTDFNTQIRASVETRRAYEMSKSADCESMLSNLKAFDKRLSNDAVIALLAAANVNADTLNRQERTSARFNVYSFAKVLSDVSAHTINHYSRAILASAVALRSAELVLTHADAVAACSLDVTHKDKSRAKIIAKSRYQKHVAANTASTQASSSINSLAALNVLIESRDAANHVCYSIADNDFAKSLVAAIAQ